MPLPAEMINNDVRASVLAMFVRNAIEDIHADRTSALPTT